VDQAHLGVGYSPFPGLPGKVHPEHVNVRTVQCPSSAADDLGAQQGQPTLLEDARAFVRHPGQTAVDELQVPAFRIYNEWGALERAAAERERPSQAERVEQVAGGEEDRAPRRVDGDQGIDQQPPRQGQVPGPGLIALHPAVDHLADHPAVVFGPQVLRTGDLGGDVGHLVFRGGPIYIYGLTFPRTQGNDPVRDHLSLDLEDEVTHLSDLAAVLHSYGDIARLT